MSLPPLTVGTFAELSLPLEQQQWCETLAHRAAGTDGERAYPLGMLRVGQVRYAVFAYADMADRPKGMTLSAAAGTACCDTITLGHACARCLSQVGVHRFYIRAHPALTLQALEAHLVKHFEPLVASLLAHDVLSALQSFGDRVFSAADRDRKFFGD